MCEQELEKKLDVATTFETFWQILGDAEESAEWYEGQCERALALANTVEQAMQVWEEFTLGSDRDIRAFAKALELAVDQKDLESIVNVFFQIRDEGPETVLHFKENLKLVFARMEELGISTKN